MANYHPVTGSRSIIDELNALRERQPTADAMEELRNTLAELEARLTDLGDTAAESPAFELPFVKKPLATQRSAPTSPRWIQPDEPQIEEPSQTPFTMQSQTTSVLESATLRQIDHRLNEISRALVAANRDKSAQEDAERLVRIEKRLQDLTGQLDTSLAEQNSDILLRRLSEVSKRIDMLSEASAMPHDVIEPLARQINLLAQHFGRLIDNPLQTDFSAIESRLDQITQRLSGIEKTASINSNAFFDRMESRFAELSTRLDERSSYQADNEAIQNLELQLATIAQHLSEPSSEFAELKPRLDTIERSIETNRESVLSAAREAAESAIERLLTHSATSDSALAAKLSDDLKSLEVLARSAEERNDKSFQAVHEVLVKVVDRLAELEQNVSHKVESPVSAKPTLLARSASTRRDEVISSAPDHEKYEKVDNPTSLHEESIGSLKPEGSAKSLPEKTVEPVQSDTDSVLDLNSIMRRVREDRKHHDNARSYGSNKADFISAARQAAQSAAEESRKLEQDLEIDLDAQSNPIGSFIQRRRKPILMGIGAILLAVTGLQFVPEFLRDYNFEKPVEEQVQLPEIDPEPTASIAPQKIDKIPAPVEQIPELPVETPHAQNNSETFNTIEEAIATAPVSNSSTLPPMETSELQELTEIPEAIGPLSLRDAATKGDANAIFEIGNRYMEGHGVAVDFVKAAAWYGKAAQLNFAPAQYRLGSFNEKGLGMPRDLPKAHEWYELAAQQGNASAMHNLAVLYASGATGSPNNAAAVRWFQEAADFDIRDSQYNLGILAAKGLGMPVDLVESYKWFSLAAKSGDKDAAEKRDQIAAALPPAQLEKAKGVVELWKAKPLNEAANARQIPDSWLEDMPATTASVDMEKAVRNIQLILQKNGYNVGSADGLMGARTRNAIKQIQKEHGLEPSGEVDPKLVDLLLSMNT